MVATENGSIEKESVLQNCHAFKTAMDCRLINYQDTLRCGLQPITKTGL